MNISFFAQPPYINRHLQRVSTILRGEQMAAHMQNARLNPTSGYQDDVCIYVKPHIKRDQEVNFEGHPYLDMVDGFELWHTLNKYPEVPAIVFSDMDMETMSNHVKNKLICIPHQHVNFERVRREREGVTRVGMIGSEGAFVHIPDEVRHGLANRGIKLIEHSIMYPRMSVVKFYQNIDVQIVWRPYQLPYRPGLYNPFKIVNTSSFGVPTIALDEPAFKEMEGCYLPVSTAEEFLEKLDALKTSSSLYGDMAKLCLQKSERYHIDNIAKLYQALT
jgi:hypothetical protein